MHPSAKGPRSRGTPAQAHHLGTVMRRGIGDAVALFNPRDGEWEARVALLRKDRCAFVVGARLRWPAPGPDLRLVVAALKRDALDWVVEKATELGVSAIQPVFTRRSVVDRVNLDRLGAIARGAAEQCERLDVPVLLPAVAAARRTRCLGWRAAAGGGGTAGRRAAGPGGLRPGAALRLAGRPGGGVRQGRT